MSEQLAKDFENIRTQRALGQMTVASVAAIDALLAFIASQSRELEELRSENYAMSQDDGKLERELERLTNKCHTLSEEINCAGITNDRLEAEIAALRRPVVQSDAAEAVFKLMRPYDTFLLWNDSKLRDLIQKWCEPMLSALDQAQREIERLTARVAEVEEYGRVYCERTDPILDGMEKLCDENSELREQIARLSSPPEERGEIVERQAVRMSAFPGCHPGSAMDDVQTLLQDLRRYSNAHAILLAERDDARQSLRQESDLHQARKDLVVQLTSERDEARGKCERLEAVRELFFGNDIVANNARKDPCYAPYCGRCKGLYRMHKVGEFHWRHHCGAEHDLSALAAADGQRDLLTAEQVLSALTPEQRAATEALRQQMFGDLPSATGDSVADGQQKPWHCKEPCPSHICLAMSAEGMCGQNCATGDGVEGE